MQASVIHFRCLIILAGDADVDKAAEHSKTSQVSSFTLVQALTVETFCKLLMWLVLVGSYLFGYDALCIYRNSF